MLKSALVFIFLAFLFFIFKSFSQVYAATCTVSLSGSPYLCETTSAGATCTPKSTTNSSGEVDIGGAGTVYLNTNPCITTSCITTNYCCSAQNPSICGYAILRTSSKSYVCKKPVPLTCLTDERACFPEQYDCTEIIGGANPATAPVLTITSTPTVTATSSGALDSGTSSADLKKKIFDVGYPSFGDVSKQALFMIPLFLALLWIL